MSVLEAADAILVGGGVTGYLTYWFQESGLAERLPPLLHRGLVYVGVSAGRVRRDPWSQRRPGTTGQHRCLLRRRVRRGFPSREPGSDAGLGLVDFALRPHLVSEDFPGVTLAAMEVAAAPQTTRSTPSTTRRLSRSSVIWSMSSPKVSGTG